MIDQLNLLTVSSLLKNIVELPLTVEGIDIDMLEQFPFPGITSNNQSFDLCKHNLKILLNNSDQTNLFVECINIASNLASGFCVSNTPYIKRPPIRLQSIFSRIQMTEKPSQECYHHLKPLSPENIFPQNDNSSAKPNDYMGLLNGFLKDADTLKQHFETKNPPLTFYINGLLSLLEKYSWCLPMPEPKLAGISQYDHSLTLAGIAQCLYIYHTRLNTMPSPEDEKEKFVFVAGDLSGIQPYIFGINRSGARGISKIFRARSFYLQSLVTSIVLYLEKKFQLTPVCQMVKAGGKFVLLFPNMTDMTPILDDMHQQIQEWFLAKFKGLLTLNLSYSIKACQKDFIGNSFQQKMEAINESLEKARYQKLKQSLKQSPVINIDYNEFHDGNCSLCTHNAANVRATKAFNEKSAEEKNICRDCFEQIDYIGTFLPKNKYTYLIYNDTASTSHNICHLFDSITLTIQKHYPDDFHGIMHVESFSESIECSETARLARFLPEITAAELSRFRQLWLTEVETEEELSAGNPKTFGMIATKAKKEVNNQLIGRTLLGFIKADIDNLGLIFSTGLKNDSASSFRTLSRMMNYYFSEYLLDLVKIKYPDIYVVFSGGDDLFLVGPWNKAIHFAIELQDTFTKFCANNPEIHLSCGILPAKQRLPMSTAAELVEEQLETAKAMTDKNAVCLLKEAVKWPHFKDLIQHIGDIFDKAIENSSQTGFSTGFLFRLLKYHNMYTKFMDYKKGINPQNIYFGNYAALASYDIGRNIAQKNLNNTKERELLYKIFSGKTDEDRKDLKHLDISLFYAINQNRS